MPSNSYIVPSSGFARAACLAKFGSSFPYLVLGEYNDGTIYNYNGTLLAPVATSEQPIFGPWVYSALDGDLPVNVSNGGTQYINNSTGGISWGPGFSSDQALVVNSVLPSQGINGGILGFNPTIPGLSFRIAGNELFDLYVNIGVGSTNPDQIFFGLYESSEGWHDLWWGDTNCLNLTGTDLGTFSIPTNTWAPLSFSAVQAGLTNGMVVTGIRWGVGGVANTVQQSYTVTFSDVITVSGGSEAILSSGYIDTTTDGGDGYYILSHLNSLIYAAAFDASPIVIDINTPSNTAYTGAVYDTNNSLFYFIRSDGTLFNYDGAVNQVTTLPGGHATPTRRLYSDNSGNLYTMLANDSSLSNLGTIGKYNISGNSWSFIDSPFSATFDEIYYSTKLYAAGSNYITISIDSNDINAAVYSISQFQLLITRPSNNTVDIWDFTPGGWTFNTSIASLGDPEFITITPDGNTALITNISSGSVQILTFSAGSWLSSSISVGVNPAMLCTAPSGNQVLVGDVGAPTVTILNKSEGTWTLGQVLNLSDLGVSFTYGIAIAYNGTQAAIFTDNNLLVFLSYNGTLWSVLNSIALPNVILGPIVDSVNTANNQFYIADTTTNTVSIYNGDSSFAGSYTISGSFDANGILVVNNQIYTPLEGTQTLNGGYYLNGLTSNTNNLGVLNSSGNTFLGVYISSPTDYPNLILFGDPNGFNELTEIGNLQVIQTSSSNFASYNGSTWTSTDIANRNRISSIAVNTSGNVVIATLDNQVYEYSGATPVSGYPFVLSPAQNQEQGATIGIDKLITWNDSNMYSSTPFNGGIVAIEP